MKDLVKCLLELNITISSCESFTGGLFVSSLSSFAGISQVYKGSIITYQNEVKENVLGIDHELIEKYGSVSEIVAIEMARSCLKLLKSDISVSFTGNAGPNPIENKEVGLCYIVIIYKGYEEIIECRFKGSRNRIRRSAVNKACRRILCIIQEKSL